jgi:hypothetical protein
MSWGALSLEPTAKQKRFQVKDNTPSQNVRVKNDIRLRLTHDLDFSMTQFDKVNKGFCNLKKINCFMNVTL